MKTMLVVFWLICFGLIFLGAVFWITDRSEVCVSSMMVEADGTTVTNPVTCLMEDSGLLIDNIQVRAQMVAALRLTFGYLALANRQASS